MAKKDLVTGLVVNYVDPDSGAGLTALGQAIGRNQDMLDRAEPQPAIGRVTFSERVFPEVMSPEQVAAFLQTSTEAVIDMAANGEIPGRQIAGEWRFSRLAITQWLGSIPD